MIWNIDPVLFEIGPLEVRYYGVFFALSLLLAYLTAKHMAKKKQLPIEQLDELIIYLIVGLVVGARFGHIVFYQLDYYLAQPIRILQVWNGGLASHGAAIGTLLAYLLFWWKQNKFNKAKLPFWTYLDLIAVVAAFPIGMVRLGNFFNSEIVGRVTEVPWAIQFTRVDELMRHPSQLYEFAIGVILFAILYPLWVKKNKTAKPGFFFGLLLALYFTMRFGVEFFKEYPEAWLGLTTGQLLSIPFVLLGIGVLGFSRFQKG